MRGRPPTHRSNYSISISKIFEKPAKITGVMLYCLLPSIFLEHNQDPEMNCPYESIIVRPANEEYENTIDGTSAQTLHNLLFLVCEKTIINIGWRPAVQRLLKGFVRHFLRANAQNAENSEICRMATDRIIEDDNINLNLLTPNGNVARRKFRPLIGKIVKVFLRWKKFMEENQAN